ncbi:MAG TPA: DUF4350 domain-containing protein [Planctomycetaceae bacterium]|nr:DUF4350 domain-containing protein [Planctomycetaceae bacterium]
MRTLKPEWLWLGGLTLLVSFHFWFPVRAPGPTHDTYSTRAGGKKAFFLLVERLGQARGIEVARSEQPLSRAVCGTPARRLDQGLSGARPVLCALGPARYPTAAEWRSLLRWVQVGGTLLIAARDDDPEFEIESLNIRVRPADGGRYGAGQLQTSLRTGRFYWESFAEIIAPQANTLIDYGGAPQAVVQWHGNGRVVVVASDFIFTNQSLAWGDNAQLAYALVHSPSSRGAPTRVEFDESLNISGVPRVVALLFDPVFRPATVQVLALLLLFGWWESRRFGPLLPQSAAARHNIVDHTDTVGLHAWKARDGSGVLAGYLSQLTAELKLHKFPGQEDRVLEPIALRLGKPVSVVRRLLDRAEKAAGLKRLDRRAAAAFIRRLALVRRAARAPARGIRRTRPL